MVDRRPKRKQPETLDAIVLKALESPKHKYRTVQGIARETKIDEQRVRTVLRGNPRAGVLCEDQDRKGAICL